MVLTHPHIFGFFDNPKIWLKLFPILDTQYVCGCGWSAGKHLHNTKKIETCFQPSKIDQVHSSYIMLYHLIVSHDIPIY